MGFPNVDLLLKDIFLREFQAAKLNPDLVVGDIFEDRPESEQVEIGDYVRAREFVSSARERGDAKRVFILPHFPSAEIPFPQIGIYHGETSGTDRFLGDIVGDADPVFDQYQNLTGWRQKYGYYEMANWNIDVVASTKEEAIWLSRFCQYFICQSFDDLARIGVLEVSLSLSDLRIDKGAMQPMEAFVRGVRVTAKTENTWIKMLPANIEFRTGNNTAL